MSFMSIMVKSEFPRAFPDAPEMERRLRILLPPEYHESYATLTAKPMGGAGLQYDADGRVAWNRIWQAFCDLAIAGGPPHKGRLLGPSSYEIIGDRADEHLDVLDELGRGLTMASELPSEDSPHLGWIRVLCHSETMAAWMYRAITTENVAVRRDGRALDLPASPLFTIEKEIKNVITVVAKTRHYWMSHIPREQKTAIGDLISALDHETPLIEPEWHDDGTANWQQVVCDSVESALALMRAYISINVLARREELTVLVPDHAPRPSV
jgi:sirohydrochlorin cobaltochelatase